MDAECFLNLHLAHNKLVAQRFSILNSLKNDRMTCLFPRQTIQYHSNPFYTPTTNAEEAEDERFYDDLQDLVELTPKKEKKDILSS